MPELTEAQRRALEDLSRPKVYAVCLGPIGRELEKAGLAEWVPPMWGNTQNWRISDRGRAALEARDG